MNFTGPDPYALTKDGNLRGAFKHKLQMTLHMTCMRENPPNIKFYLAVPPKTAQAV